MRRVKSTLIASPLWLTHARGGGIGRRGGLKIQAGPSVPRRWGDTAFYLYRKPQRRAIWTARCHGGALDLGPELGTESGGPRSARRPAVSHPFAPFSRLRPRRSPARFDQYALDAGRAQVSARSWARFSLAGLRQFRDLDVLLERGAARTPARSQLRHTSPRRTRAARRSD